MKAVEIAKGIFWVGVVDWSIRNFHGHTFQTPKGTTYNAYLIIDEKVALVDTVMAPFGQELVDNISALVPVEKIDYVIANHVEADHSGALPFIMEKAKNAAVVANKRCLQGLKKHYYKEWKNIEVKTGDELKLGQKILTFIEAPMIHWPDSMFTYLPQQKVLLPNDAFGQHYASSQRFDDELKPEMLMDEALKYYANILWPLKSVILSKLEDIKKQNLEFKIIAPSHGIIWRKEPERIINSYFDWSSEKTLGKVVIVYETMWGSTEKMARRITDAINDEGLEVKLFDINSSDRTEVIKELFTAKGFLFGSSTHDNGMLPAMAALLELIKGFKPKRRLGSVFGSFGWGRGAGKQMSDKVLESGIELVQEALEVKYVPDDKENLACYNWGKSFAEKVKQKMASQ